MNSRACFRNLIRRFRFRGRENRRRDSAANGNKCVTKCDRLCASELFGSHLNFRQMLMAADAIRQALAVNFGKELSFTSRTSSARFDFASIQVCAGSISPCLSKGISARLTSLHNNPDLRLLPVFSVRKMGLARTRHLRFSGMRG